MGKRRRGRRPGPGTCVYCGEETTVVDEHVFPRALWRESDRLGVDFICVSSCDPCNTDKSRYDDALRDRVDLDHTSSERPEHRDQLEKIARSTVYGSSRLGRTAEPLVAAAIADPEGTTWPLKIPYEPEPINKAVEYIVRGLYYHHLETPLTKDRYAVRVRELELDEAEEFFTGYNKCAHQGGDGLGDVCHWAYDLGRNDSADSLWVLVFKEGVVFQVVTKRNDSDDPARPPNSPSR